MVPAGLLQRHSVHLAFLNLLRSRARGTQLSPRHPHNGSQITFIGWEPPSSCLVDTEKATKLECKQGSKSRFVNTSRDFH